MMLLCPYIACGHVHGKDRSSVEPYLREDILCRPSVTLRRSSSFEAMLLPRLATTRSSTLFLFVPAHACTKGNVDTRGRLKSKALRYFDQVELVRVED